MVSTAVQKCSGIERLWSSCQRFNIRSICCLVLPAVGEPIRLRPSESCRHPTAVPEALVLYYVELRHKLVVLVRARCVVLGLAAWVGCGTATFCSERTCQKSQIFKIQEDFLLKLMFSNLFWKIYACLIIHFSFFVQIICIGAQQITRYLSVQQYGSMYAWGAGDWLIRRSV